MVASINNITVSKLCGPWNIIRSKAQVTLEINSIYSVWLIDRFRNGNILDKEEYNNNETLVLRKVGKNMAGDFRCRAVNEFGAEFSEPATLIVLGKCLYTFKETLLRISILI